MSRYIDAEYNLRDLYCYFDFSDEELTAISTALKEIPTADVVERKCGEWIIRDSIHLHSICSCCGYYNAISPYYVYCPNCGATMSYERRINNGD